MCVSATPPPPPPSFLQRSWAIQEEIEVDINSIRSQSQALRAPLDLDVMLKPSIWARGCRQSNGDAVAMGDR